MQYEIIIPSHRPGLIEETLLCLKGLNIRVVDGTGYPSFSKLINDCIITSSCETLVICNDKARPDHDAVDKVLNMLEQDWGVVAPYRFGFFGFKKDLIRKIGFFDERYRGGGYEDNDIILRLKEADISYFESEEINYVNLPTSWKYESSPYPAAHYYAKWNVNGNIITRRLGEEDYGYDIGPFNHAHFSAFKQSRLLPVRRNLKEQIMQVDLLPPSL